MIVRLVFLALLQQVVVVEAKLLFHALRLKQVESLFLMLIDAASKTTRPLSMGVELMCDRHYLGCLIINNVIIVE